MNYSSDKLSRFLVPVLALLLILSPFFVSAQGLGLIVCDPATGDDCDFNDLVKLAQNVINALILLATFIAVAVFSYAGIILISSGGDESAMTRAKTMFLKVLKGYLWILFAWLLIYTITRALLAPGFDFLGPPR